MPETHIARIEWGTLEGRRPRNAGSNARLGDHGVRVRLPLVCLTDSDGVSGFGPCRTAPERLQMLLGTPVEMLLTSEGITDAWLDVEYPLWDLMGQRERKPVYALLAPNAPMAGVRVPCYDTSLYFDDLHLPDTDSAVALLTEEAHDGWERGHRAFKIKVGRGARHLPLEAGTQRDIAIVNGIRALVGANIPLMIDANNGYNLNLAKRVLTETADGGGTYWLEEAFHEDAVLYHDLKAWIAAQGLSTLLADGEGEASPSLMRWAKEGLVDVIQYDIFGHGITRWLRTGRQLDEWGAHSAPHHYGGHFGNYATGHLAPALKNFTFVEWDEVTTPGLDASAYSIDNGHVLLPALPGFGLRLEEDIFQSAIRNGGGALF